MPCGSASNRVASSCPLAGCLRFAPAIIRISLRSWPWAPTSLCLRHRPARNSPDPSQRANSRLTIAHTASHAQLPGRHRRPSLHQTVTCRYKTGPDRPSPVSYASPHAAIAVTSIIPRRHIIRTLTRLHWLLQLKLVYIYMHICCRGIGGHTRPAHEASRPV